MSESPSASASVPGLSPSLSPPQQSFTLETATASLRDGPSSLAALRDALTRPSPLDAFLRDPEVKDILSRKSSSRSLGRSLFRRRTSRSASASSRQRSPMVGGTADSVDADDDDSSARGPGRPRLHATSPAVDAGPPSRPVRRAESSVSLVSVILADEARSTAHVRSALQSTLHQLDGTARAELEASTRASHAERTARELGARLATAETGRAQALTETADLREQLTRIRADLERERTQHSAAAAELASLRPALAQAETDRSRARDRAHRAEVSLADALARDEGRRAGVRAAMEENFARGRADGHIAGHAEGYETGHADGYEIGRDEGFEAGRLAAFEEGRARGRAEGFDDGYDVGRREAQVAAIQAFERVLDDEHAAEQAAAARSRSPPARPMWLKRRPTGDSEHA